MNNLASDARQVARQRWFAAGAGLLGWFGLALQLSVVIQARQANGADIAGGVVNFLSYFTVWCNLLASVALSCIALNWRWRLAAALTRPAAMTGLAACILLVAIAYHLLLRRLWHPEGVRMLADNLLHYAVPALFLIFWWLFIAPAQVGWRHALCWAMLPVIYFVFAMSRGAVSGMYAYPFIDASRLGYGQVLLNAIGVLAGFLCIAVALIWLDKRKR